MSPVGFSSRSAMESTVGQILHSPGKLSIVGLWRCNKLMTTSSLSLNVLMRRLSPLPVIPPYCPVVKGDSNHSLKRVAVHALHYVTRLSP